MTEKQLSPETRQIISISRNVALKNEHPFVSSEHLFIAMLVHESNTGVQLLEKCELNCDELLNFADKHLKDFSQVKSKSQVKPEEVYMSPKATAIVALAIKISEECNSKTICPEHILVSLLTEQDGMCCAMLRDYKLDPEELRLKIMKHLKIDKLADELTHESFEKQMHTASPISNTPLGAFGTNMIELAEDGEISPCIGRKDEIDRIYQILLKQTKSNPIIVGADGVGKTSLVNHIACEIAAGIAPPQVVSKTIVKINIASILSGTMYRGQFEERMLAIINQAIQMQDIILFFDGLDNMVSNEHNALNMIKPVLATGKISCIICASQSEYHKFAVNDNIIKSNFEMVVVNECTTQQAIEIVRAYKYTTEAYHTIEVPDNVCEYIVKQTSRYIHSRRQPSVSIDLLDELGASLRYRRFKDAVERGTEVIEASMKEHEQLLASDDAEQIAEFEKTQKALAKEIAVDISSLIEADVEDINLIIEKMTGIPTTKIDSTESNKLITLEAEFNKSILHQEHAVKSMVNVIKRQRLGITDSSRPYGSFLFIGSTGVGKTHLAKTLAKLMLGDEKKVIQVDMSELMDKHSSNRFIGAPPGYIGSDSPPEFIQKVKNNPYSVVLFDEIEKAHPEVLNMLLQVLEEGRLTTATGQECSFRNCYVIMTSNIGAAKISDGVKTMGFGCDETDTSYDAVIKEVKKALTPEFINRIDEIIMFNRFTKSQLVDISKLLINQCTKHINESINVNVDVNSSVCEYIVDNTDDIERYGARPIRRFIEKDLHGIICDEYLKNTDVSDIKITVSRGKLKAKAV